MDKLRSSRDAIAVIIGLVAPAAIAAALIPLRASLANTAAALVLVAVVVAVAANGARLAGYIAAISAALWFDFFLTVPYERFEMTHRADIETAISLFLVGVAVTEIAVRNRYHRRVAAEGSEHVGLIHRFSGLAAAGSAPEEVVERANRELTELLGLRSCRYEPGRLASAPARIASDGNVFIGKLWWAVEDMGLPGREVELAAQHQGRVVGRFVLTPTPGLPISLQRRVVAVAIADQVAAALSLRLAS